MRVFVLHLLLFPHKRNWTRAFLNWYLAVPWQTFDHSPGDNLTNQMLITAFLQFWPEGLREPRNKAGSLSPTEHLIGFEPETFRFWFHRLNPLGRFTQTKLCMQKSPSWFYRQDVLTSWRKLALTHKLSVQIRKASRQHGKADTTMT